MQRRVIFGIILTLCLVGMLTLTFSLQTVKAEPTTWYVDDDGGADFTRIQDAIVAASSGDVIYVYSGTYYEHLSIYKYLTIIGEDKSNTIIDGSGTGAVIKIYEDYVTISGFTVRNSGWDWFYILGSGIYTGYGNEFVNISNNIISNTRYGISLWGADNTIIRGNIISDAEQGISFDGPDYYDIISQNTISNTELAIFFDGPSYFNKVVGNQISNSGTGIYFNNPYHNAITDNTIEDMTGDVRYGIHFQEGGSNNTVTGNTVIGYCDYGIAIRYTDENQVAGNTLIGNFYGIELGHSSCDNAVIENNAPGNGLGISVFENSNNNLIAMNNFSDSVPVGFYISDIGIWVESSHDNTIHYNNITNNGYGFYISSTSNNQIYHNSLIDNIIQVYSFNSINMWDNGYPSGGNYWSDYSTMYPSVGDDYHGENQDILGSDGIWDHPYEIDVDNQDNYPLVEP